MKSLLYTFFGLLLSVNMYAQEFNVSVTINTPKLQATDPKVFETLKSAIEEFYTNTKWTEDFFETEERINLDISLTITKESGGSAFEGELSFRSSRPVYGSNYETVVFNHIDKDVRFSYEQFQPIIYSQNSFTDNLTSLMAFYANIVLGFDYDSFAAFGGEPYFQIANEIVNIVPESVARSAPGWRSVDGRRNRYWLIENILTPRVKPFRQAFYDYHRLGLDEMHKNVVVGRAVIKDALEKILKVHQDYPNSLLMQVFSNTKSQEVLDIFYKGLPEEKKAVLKTMTALNPSNARTFNALR